jgi:hypothetical protein
MVLNLKPGCKLKVSAVFAFLLFFFINVVKAEEHPDALPGWVKGAAVGQGGSETQGITLDSEAVIYSSPVVGDIDNNPGNGLETVVGGADGAVSAYSANGIILWRHELPNYGSGTNHMLGGPAIGPVYGDGIQYVVAPYGGVPERQDGGVVCLRGYDGQEMWRFSTKTNSKRYKYGVPVGYGVVSSPALSDTDGDGKMEIGFGSFDRNVYLLDHNGSLRWFYTAADTVWSSAAFSAASKSNRGVMYIGTDISQNKALRPPTKNGGFVYAFKTLPRTSKKIGFRDRSAYLWATYLPQVVYSAPIVADVLPSPGDEIVVLSGCYFSGGNWVKILSAKSGKVLQTLPIDHCSTSTAAVGDIDDDGKLEIVVTANGGSDGKSHIVAFNPEDTNPIWSIVPYDKGTNDENGGNFMSPVIADVDGNGSLEVIAANGSSVSIFNGKDGSALTCQNRGCSDHPFSLETGGMIKSTPAIADVNNDGVLDIIAGSGAINSNKGGLFGWTNLRNFISSPAGGQAPYAAPWPMSRGNANHTARFN